MKESIGAKDDKLNDIVKERLTEHGTRVRQNERESLKSIEFIIWYYRIAWNAEGIQRVKTQKPQRLKTQKSCYYLDGQFAIGKDPNLSESRKLLDCWVNQESEILWARFYCWIIFCSICIKMNNIINKSSLAGGNFMPKCIWGSSDLHIVLVDHS